MTDDQIEAIQLKQVKHIYFSAINPTYQLDSAGGANNIIGTKKSNKDSFL